MANKTDNTNLALKLNLRRHLLEIYKPRFVFDACQGSGLIWKALRKEYPCKYLGVDVKPKRGRLKARSERLLALPGWIYDVIDIDTYGSCWSHWLALLPQVKNDCTVFLTIGKLNISNSPKEIRGVLGIPPSTPRGIATKLWDLAAQYALSRCADYNIMISDAVEARSGNARYIGMRLKIGAGVGAPTPNNSG